MSDLDFKAEILRCSYRAPLDVLLDSPVLTLLKDILGTESLGAPYYTETISYTETGIPPVICGPGSIDQAHTPDEYLVLSKLITVWKQIRN